MGIIATFVIAITLCGLAIVGLTTKIKVAKVLTLCSLVFAIMWLLDSFAFDIPSPFDPKTMELPAAHEHVDVDDVDDIDGKSQRSVERHDIDDSIKHHDEAVKDWEHRVKQDT